MFPQSYAFPYTYEIGEGLSAGGHGTNPSAVGSALGPFSYLRGAASPNRVFANFTLPR